MVMAFSEYIFVVLFQYNEKSKRFLIDLLQNAKERFNLGGSTHDHKKKNPAEALRPENSYLWTCLKLKNTLFKTGLHLTEL